MMNKIYDFTEIQEIRLRQRRLILYYIFYTLCFIAAIILCCFLIKNHLLLTVVFSFLLFFYILFSICFWKIKYGILDKYRSFLDDLETGKQDDFVGVFEKKTDAEQDEEWFDLYVFTSSAGKSSFLIHKQHKTCFDVGRKYHITHVGKYLYEWKNAE